RRPWLDGCRHVLRILAPIAQWTDFSADRNRDHFSAGLPQGAQGSLLRGVLNDDAVQLARVGSEPFLDLALRNLVRPHATERTNHCYGGVTGERRLAPLVLRVRSRRAGYPLNAEPVALPPISLAIHSPSMLPPTTKLAEEFTE